MTTDASESRDRIHDGIHEFVAPALVPVTPEQARRITMSRRSLMIHDKTWVTAQDVYCELCRRWFKDVADQPCTGPHSPHLIGGNGPEVRKKRKLPIAGSTAGDVALRQRSGLGDMYG